MNNGAKDLVPVVALVTVLSLVAAVLLFAGIPMAGTASAIIATVVAMTLTLAMAAAFSHKEKTGH